MNCALCRTPIALWELSADGYAGLPVHEWCGHAERQALADALDEAAAYIAKRRATQRDRRTAA